MEPLVNDRRVDCLYNRWHYNCSANKHITFEIGPTEELEDYWITVGFEALAIPVSISILQSSGLNDDVLAAIAIIVGIHFFGLITAFPGLPNECTMISVKRRSIQTHCGTRLSRLSAPFFVLALGVIVAVVGCKEARTIEAGSASKLHPNGTPVSPFPPVGRRPGDNLGHDATPAHHN